MALINLIFVVGFLGVSSFIVGMLPLSVSLSQQRLAQFTTLGTGLLLGAAMGVIIPEGIEATYDALPKSSSTSPTSHSHESSPSLRIAMSLLSGFTLMFIIEQVVAPALLKESQPQRATPLPSYSRAATSDVPDSPSTMGGPDLDIELEMELNALGVKTRDEATRRNPKMLTLGLVIHSLADGVALGAANALTATPVSGGSATGASEGAAAAGSVGDKASGLSVIVFLAIAIHKAPTALALTSTLISQLSTRRIRQHLIAFSVSSPISALFTYFVLTYFGGVEHVEEWTGTVLMFSGGTFLYVATVLSSLPAHAHGHSLEHSGAELSTSTRAGLTIVGMFIPVILSTLVGHGH